MRKETIEVIVKNETEGEKVPVSSPSESGGSSAGVAATQRTVKAARDKGLVASGLVAVQQIAPYVETAVGFGVSQIGVTTGSEELQQRVELLTGATTAGAKIIGGAMVGGGAGAAVMLAVQAVQSTVSFAFARTAIGNQRRLENESINLRKSRLGMAVNRSRTGGIS